MHCQEPVGSNLVALELENGFFVLQQKHATFDGQPRSKWWQFAIEVRDDLTGDVLVPDRAVVRDRA